MVAGSQAIHKNQESPKLSFRFFRTYDTISRTLHEGSSYLRNAEVDKIHACKTAFVRHKKASLQRFHHEREGYESCEAVSLFNRSLFNGILLMELMEEILHHLGWDG